LSPLLVANGTAGPAARMALSARTKAFGALSWSLTGLSVPEPALTVKMRTTRHHMDSSSGWPMDVDSWSGWPMDVDSWSGWPMDVDSWSGWPIDMDCSCDMLIPSLFLICVLFRYAGLS